MRRNLPRNKRLEKSFRPSNPTVGQQLVTTGIRSWTKARNGTVAAVCHISCVNSVIYTI
jgi:hypothetical protein